MKKITEIFLFSNEYQNELKKKYEKALFTYWEDEKMVKYLMKQILYLIPICDGKYMIQIDKQKLTKDFYFGYSDIGQGLSYEENNERIKEFKNNIGNEFREKNLSTINNTIEMISKVFNGTTEVKMYHFPHWHKKSESDDSMLRDYGFDDPWRGKTFVGEGKEFEKTDIDKLLTGLIYLKKYTEKKIDSYLKKYGSSKINISTYWIDR